MFKSLGFSRSLDIGISFIEEGAEIVVTLVGSGKVVSNCARLFFFFPEAAFGGGKLPSDRLELLSRGLQLFSASVEDFLTKNR